MALPRCTVPARRSGCDRIVLRAGSTCRRVLLIALDRMCHAVLFGDAGRFASSGVDTGHRISGPFPASVDGPVVSQGPAGQWLPGLVT